MRASWLLPAVLLAWALPALAATPWTLEQLLQGFAQTREAHASFVEKKSVRVLERPLVSAGELHFNAPDRLEKRTLRPRPELLRLDGDALTLERGERRLKLSLRGQPEATAFVVSIRGTLAGDRAALERVYRLQLEGSERSWVLTLTPREPGMAALVERIRIAGRRAEVSVIEIEHANGDSTLMSVQRLPAP
ncbi:MAG: outer membrane lipoprotein carrier protein LolA [Betaproteobacteria bacterium]|nr:outer membrane lipoprotein carrier protein LolA [Betaproteobacteria bacterium]